MMAKAAASEETNLPSVPEPGTVPAFLKESVVKDAGKGVSTRAEDNLVPLIYILQAQSPQAQRKDPNYVEGGEAGAIWLRNSGVPAINGDDGILFQPCYFHVDWVEWIPRSKGGGFVGRHLERPADAEQKQDPQNPNKFRWVRPNGNEVVQTRYHTGYVIFEDMAIPYVIPMTSSGHTVSRNWMFMMNRKKAFGVKPPSWACLYRLRTKPRTNAAGTWMTWDISDAGWVQEQDEYNRGEELNNSFEAGEKMVETPVQFEEVDPDSAPM
jgi:hypothetical protein